MIGKQQTIPTNWVMSPLCEVAEINPRLDKSAFAEDVEVLFVPMPAVEAETGKIDVSQIRTFGEVKKGYTPFKRGDVLFAKITPCMENGKMAVVPDLHNNIGFGSTEFHVLRHNHGVEPSFLYYFVSSKGFRFDAKHNMTGAVGQKRVPTTYLEKCHIPLPPSREQERIVSKLEELLSELDKGIESFKTAREQLTVYRQAVLKHAFEGKLTEEWRKKHADELEPAETLLEKIKAEREQRYQQQLDDWKQAVKASEAGGKAGKKPTKPKIQNEITTISEDDYGSLPCIPLTWKWVSLHELVSGLPRSMQSGPFGSNLKHSAFQESGILVIGIDNVGDGDFSKGSQNRISEEKYRELVKYEARPGDLLVTVMASLGRTCVVPRDIEKAIISKHVYRITMEQSHLLPEFFNLVLQSHTVSRLKMFDNAQGQTRPGLNSTILKELPVPLCSLKEQKEIYRRLNDKLSFLDRFDNEIEQNLQRSEALRQSLLKKAFQGKLVPQDPNDEPASVLLERIKMEKAKLKKNARKEKKVAV